MDEYKDQIDEEKFFKPKLYQYPEHGQPSTVFDFDDLDNDAALLVLCARAQPDNENRKEDQVYVWQGEQFQEISTGQTVLDTQTFVQKCIENYWGSKEAKKLGVTPLYETPQEESDEFMYYFD